MLRIIIRPAGLTQNARLWEARLNGALLCISRQPFYDGARELLRRGYDPETPLNLRHEGGEHDSFAISHPIREWARWTTKESDKRPIHRVTWKPYFSSPVEAETRVSTEPVPKAA